MRIIVSAEPADGEVEEIRSQLRSYNRQFVSLTDEPRFVLRSSGDNDTLTGGLVCTITGTWLEIEYLWIDPKCRGEGLGTAMVGKAEDIGREHGCSMVFLNTFDFQARPFYEKLGYSVVYTQHRYPQNGNRFFMEKALSALE